LFPPHNRYICFFLVFWGTSAAIVIWTFVLLLYDFMKFVKLSKQKRILSLCKNILGFLKSQQSTN
jgi:hypothetical protein